MCRELEGGLKKGESERRANGGGGGGEPLFIGVSGRSLKTSGEISSTRRLTDIMNLRVFPTVFLFVEQIQNKK